MRSTSQRGATLNKQPSSQYSSFKSLFVRICNFFIHFFGGKLYDKNFKQSCLVPQCDPNCILLVLQVQYSWPFSCCKSLCKKIDKTTWIYSLIDNVDTISSRDKNILIELLLFYFEFEKFIRRNSLLKNAFQIAKNKEQKKQTL